MRSIVQKRHWQNIPNYGCCTLKDSQSGMKVNVEGLPAKALVFTIPDGGKTHIPILDNNSNCRKSCDNLILIPRNGCLEVYFIEMKETLKLSMEGVPEKACDQILCTVPVLDYLTSMAEYYFQIKQTINKYFIVIAEKKSSRLDKQNVKPSKFAVQIYKDKKFKIIHSTPSISFQSLQ